MSNVDNYIEISLVCQQYEIEMSFIDDLSEYGLIEISTIEQAHFIHHDRISDLEKILRLHRDLDINIEGISSVLLLLQKIDRLQAELNAVHNRLQLYEGRED